MRCAVFIVELITRAGRVSESYETYEEARRRVDFDRGIALYKRLGISGMFIAEK